MRETGATQGDQGINCGQDGLSCGEIYAAAVHMKASGSPSRWARPALSAAGGLSVLQQRVLIAKAQAAREQLTQRHLLVVRWVAGPRDGQLEEDIQVARAVSFFSENEVRVEGGGGCGSQCRRGPLGSHARQVSDEMLCCFVPAPAYLGAEHEEPLRASGAELWVGGSLAPLCDPQHGTIVRHGAGLGLARSGQRRHKGRVAAQGSSHRRCAVDDQVKTAPVVWRNAGSSGGAEPLLRDHLAICPNGFARNSHPRPFDDLGSPSQEPSARAGQGMVAEDVDAQTATQRKLHGLRGQRGGWALGDMSGSNVRSRRLLSVATGGRLSAIARPASRFGVPSLQLADACLGQSRGALAKHRECVAHAAQYAVGAASAVLDKPSAGFRRVFVGSYTAYGSRSGATGGEDVVKKRDVAVEISRAGQAQGKKAGGKAAGGCHGEQGASSAERFCVRAAVPPLACTVLQFRATQLCRYWRACSSAENSRSLLCRLWPTTGGGRDGPLAKAREKFDKGGSFTAPAATELESEDDKLASRRLSELSVGALLGSARECECSVGSATC
ncbi:hypothetical protein AK812_SmicGene42319 [Symbiodinium microadriaticum]|uniref:Uncharacterized protein n=1 Tax=Symbiodinium microadriaticum TaxID=2951 RepID=A0A1Q9C3W0_SYMMI|nr:hypothetical protein AK812_SmicGene42319 [Symbiodinium microadriaticum]